MNCASLKTAYARELACDPVSAFGGIVAMNRILDAEAAEEIVKTTSPDDPTAAIDVLKKYRELGAWD